MTISGAFEPAVSPAGLVRKASISVPSKLLNVNGSTEAIVRVERSAALSAVAWRMALVAASSDFTYSSAGASAVAKA